MRLWVGSTHPRSWASPLSCIVKLALLGTSQQGRLSRPCRTIGDWAPLGSGCLKKCGRGAQRRLLCKLAPRICTYPPWSRQHSEAEPTSKRVSIPERDQQTGNCSPTPSRNCSRGPCTLGTISTGLGIIALHPSWSCQDAKQQWSPIQRGDRKSMTWPAHSPIPILAAHCHFPTLCPHFQAFPVSPCMLRPRFAKLISREGGGSARIALCRWV